MIVVRYADDRVAGFEHEDDARRFLDALRERFGAFSLSLHPGKVPDPPVLPTRRLPLCLPLATAFPAET